MAQALQFANPFLVRALVVSVDQEHYLGAC